MRAMLLAIVGVTLAQYTMGAAAQSALAEKRIDLVIQSATLADALNQWAAQSGFQLVSPSWDVAMKLGPRSLKGTFTAQAALDELLKGTPLTYVWLNDKAVKIHERKGKAANDG